MSRVNISPGMISVWRSQHADFLCPLSSNNCKSNDNLDFIDHDKYMDEAAQIAEADVPMLWKMEGWCAVIKNDDLWNCSQPLTCEFQSVLKLTLMLQWLRCCSGSSSGLYLCRKILCIRSLLIKVFFDQMWGNWVKLGRCLVLRNKVWRMAIR